MGLSNEYEASDYWWLRIVECRWSCPLFNWFQCKPKPDYTSSDGSNFVRIKDLGTGACGNFYLCRDCSNDELVIVKDIPLPLSESIQISLMNEVSLIEELDHPNIVRLLYSTVKDRFIWLVFEKLDCNLKDIITHQDYVYHPLATKTYLHQMLSAVAYCHARRILHRNLNLQNILVDITKMKLKVDFSMATPIRVPGATNTYVGAPGYKAPEILLTNLEHSTAIDVWSLGCIFANMLRRKKLFQSVADKRQELIQMIRVVGLPTEETWPGFTKICTYASTKIPQFRPTDLREVFPDLEPDGLDLLSKMLSLNPKRRISAREALDHPYFKDLN